jgi:hypothetical protein
VQTEIPEGGVVVRKSAHVSGRLVTRPAVARCEEPTFASGSTNIRSVPQ